MENLIVIIPEARWEYLATNHELERYHGDLALFINKQSMQDKKGIKN